MKQLTYALLLAALCTLRGAAQTVYVNLENPRVKAFLDEVAYDRASASQVEVYNVAPPARRDVPAAAVLTVDRTLAGQELTLCYSLNVDLAQADTVAVSPLDNGNIEVYNLVPQRTYYYVLTQGDEQLASGCICTGGRVRMIHAPSAFNIRDCGGWTTTDGRRVKYGKIYRGSELNGLCTATPADVELLRRLGVGAELDFRYTGELDEVEAAGYSAFGFSASDSTYLCTENSGCYREHLTGNAWTSRYRRAFEFIVDNLKRGRAVYQHCIWGADRTGLLSLLMGGVLGVDYDQLVKDYELTTFADQCTTRQKAQHLDDIIDYIDALPGNTLQARFEYYLRYRVRLAQADIDYLKEELLEDAVESDYDQYVAVGISTAGQDLSPRRTAVPAFDLQGRPLNHGRGLVISQGRKRLSR